ncbi:ribosomal protein S18-alanine N-acetyltransferase [Rhizobium sp. CG4]|jgi:ribosomal-protein-alanine N-acetyltransferase|uniref:ribosomal protein S18-alanine N-acetyltransferase n=1 Tax=Rhizobium/Agrobacterium group TaxID=227290 RepID=UPI001780507E|nr:MULTISPECIES: ribosomal protein S18-alanine N-acetyltransferase [Rhizobium/Agrobacterium group]MBD9385624.1 ribosomal protein S18-alanine N-acetyltransferase [Agrobacterium sp. AGB01]MCM2455843.1 ribosomal protein S18-alanine N-acetyltransferase [Rhizobium sp. CG4]MCS4243871.1 ribosomal-protein-alanine N-acetyltransferase [Rhizobium sp. BIGb0125]MDO5894139.1 ribosomal protein S18-alanine N-acetyltransferase [Agrobacterium sp. Azo12]
MIDQYLTLKPQFEIVPLVQDDSHAIAELHKLRFSRPWSEDEFGNLLVQSNCYGFVARQTNAFFSKPLSGFVLAREAGGEAEILTIAVQEKLGRAGLGWRLMQAAVREAAGRGADSMFLEVDTSNAAGLGLYRKLGFQQVAERKAYYTAPDGTQSTALVMRRDLR